MATPSYNNNTMPYIAWLTETAVGATAFEFKLEC